MIEQEQGQQLTEVGRLWLAQTYSAMVAKYEAKVFEYAYLLEKGKTEKAAAVFNELIDFMDGKLYKAWLALKTNRIGFKGAQ